MVKYSDIWFTLTERGALDMKNRGILVRVVAGVLALLMAAAALSALLIR